MWLAACVVLLTLTTRSQDQQLQQIVDKSEQA